MDFFTKLAGFLITKHAIRSYQKDLQNEYLRNQAILAERERKLRAEEKRAEEKVRICEENMRRTFEEVEERHRLMVLKHEARLAEHEAKIAQLKQEEGEHSAEIEEQEFLADHERDMVRIYKKTLGIDE